MKVEEIPTVLSNLFSSGTELLSSVTELFELEIAYLEYKNLTKDELIERSGYFKKIDDKFTQHYLLYSNQSEALIEDRSSLTKNYFENGHFATGYATHGLFPYRGKFHPQLIKGLLNIIGVKKGDLVLDPMCGSGTANIEAALMGINSYAIDLSPFCQLMTEVKYEALKIDSNLLSNLYGKNELMFEFFSGKDCLEKLEKINNIDKYRIYKLVLLAYLDSMGYSKRVSRFNHRQLFNKVLDRYMQTTFDFIKNPSFNATEIGNLEILKNSEARSIKLDNETVDAVITSPPYSFAIDYVSNDEPQLTYLGYNIIDISNNMIGIQGKTVKEKLEIYFHDMEIVCVEIARVLKPDKYFVMIIGSNTNQTGGIRLEENMIKFCENYGLILVKSILKPIKGMRNTMKDEFILFFRKTGV